MEQNETNAPAINVTSAMINESDGTTGQDITKGDGVKTRHIQDEAVTGSKIADNAITTSKIAEKAVKSKNIAGKSIETAHLVNGAINGSKIAGGAVRAAKIGGAAVITKKLANLAVTNAKLGDSSVTDRKIMKNTITEAKLHKDVRDKLNAVPPVPDGSITKAKIADGAVTTSKIKYGSVNEDKLSTDVKNKLNAPGTGGIADGSVTTPKLAYQAVTSDKIMNGHVNENKLSQAVRDKLNSPGGNGGDIADGSVTTAKIANLAVTRAKMAYKAVNDSIIDDDAVTNPKIRNGSVSEEKLGNDVKNKLVGATFWTPDPQRSHRVNFMAETIYNTTKMVLYGERALKLVNKHGVFILKWPESTGNLTVEGNIYASQDIFLKKCLVVDEDIIIAGSRRIYSPGRMHIHGEEILHLLNKSGVIVAKSWGGNGNLTVEGNLATHGNSWARARTGAPVDYAELFESTNGKQIKPGTSVTLDDGKIRPAKKGETPIGIISTNPLMVGGIHKEWPKKYLRDEFGRQVMEDVEEEIMTQKKETVREERQKLETKTVKETVTRLKAVEIDGKYCQKEVTETIEHDEQEPVYTDVPLYDEAGEAIIGKHQVPIMEMHEEVIDVTDDDGKPVMVGTGKFETRSKPKLNPKYDSSLEYVPREDRDEWNCVGLLGQLHLSKGQPVAPSWVKIKDISDKVELWLVK